MNARHIRRLGATLALAIGLQTGLAAVAHADFNDFVSVGDAARCEASTGAWDFGFAVFPITLAWASSQPISVSWGTMSNTAWAGSDYQGTGGTVTFQPGETQKNVLVALTQDGVLEGTESFFVKLTGVSGPGYLYDKEGVGTIVDSGGRLVVLDAAGAEGGTATFPVFMCREMSSTVQATYGTADGSATAPADYTSTAGTLSFAAGENYKSVGVPLKADGALDGTEQFSLKLLSATNIGIADGTAVGTIYDMTVT
jgi:hypothetical protein